MPHSLPSPNGKSIPPDEEEFEEEMTIAKPGESGFTYYVRQSEFILVFRLIFLQLIMGLLQFAVYSPVVISTYYGGDQSLTNSIYMGLVALVQLFDIVLIVFVVLNWLKTVYIVQNDRVVEHRGIFRVIETEYTTSRIETVNVEQGFVGRIFDYGTVRIFNPVIREDLMLHNIPNPYIYAAVINKQQSKEMVRFLPHKPE